MDTVFGVRYNGGVILAADQSNAHSIMVYQSNLDKICELTSHSAMAVAGPNCDAVNFTEYISKNIKLYELANDGTKLSMHAQANFARGELAKAIRRGPYQVNILMGGYDLKTTSSSEEDPAAADATTTTTAATSVDAPVSMSTDAELSKFSDFASLYWLDYMGTLHQVPYGAQGYAAYFCLSIMDREYKDPSTMTKDNALTIVEHCITELQKRFLISQPNFIVKSIDKDGIRVVKFGDDPANT